jgi:hypothetical protein
MLEHLNLSDEYCSLSSLSVLAKALRYSSLCSLHLRHLSQGYKSADAEWLQQLSVTLKNAPSYFSHFGLMFSGAPLAPFFNSLLNNSSITSLDFRSTHFQDEDDFVNVLTSLCDSSCPIRYLSLCAFPGSWLCPLVDCLHKTKLKVLDLRAMTERNRTIWQLYSFFLAGIRESHPDLTIITGSTSV